MTRRPHSATATMAGRALGAALASALVSAPALSADGPTGLSASLSAGTDGMQDDGAYVGLGVGAVLGAAADLDRGANADIDTDPGAAVGVTFGYRTATGLRPEFEAAYRRSSIDDISGAAGSRGRLDTLTFMGNLNYDIDLGADIRPYVGVGAGLAAVTLDGAAPVGGSRVDDTALAPALQGIAGVGYRFTDALEGYADYRYLRAVDAEFKTDAGAEADATVSSHTLSVGVRWFFNAPGAISQTSKLQPAVAEAEAAEPAPAAAPAEAAPSEPEPEPIQPPRVLPEYLVFFGFDKSTLMPEAMEVVRLAAENARSGGRVRIEATGHADRAGPEAYNQGLSQRRAEAVRRALIDLGVDAAAITVRGRGETMPLVKTADGVREPQNRRVEIILNEN
jgi:OOP family OmpA-OmpF porin